CSSGRPAPYRCHERGNDASRPAVLCMRRCRRVFPSHNRTEGVPMKRPFSAFAALVLAGAIATVLGFSVRADGAPKSYDINTLAGKVASLKGTAGLQIRFSAFIDQESDAAEVGNPGPFTPINPSFVLSSPLDGTSILSPNVLVNGYTAAAPQYETSIAVDPNNASR